MALKRLKHTLTLKLNSLQWYDKHLNACAFTVPLWSNSRYSILHTSAHNLSFPDILTNFNLLRTLDLMCFGPLFPRIYGRHRPCLFQVLVENWRKWHHFLTNTTRVEIIITTITTAICIKNNKNFGSYICAIFHINCYYNFNFWGIFEKMTSFSQTLNQDLEQGKSMASINSRK